MQLLTIAGILVLIKLIYGFESEFLNQLIQTYEDDKNAMIADLEQDTMTDAEVFKLYEDFYEELDNELVTENCMNIIFFGPVSEFLRIDTESLIHLMTITARAKIPLSRVILAWDMVTDGKTAAFLEGRELLAFDTLLNVVPEEDLYFLNFGDPSVLHYFANNMNKLHKRKYGVLVSAYRRYYGDTWILSSSHINSLGYLICGFPTPDLKHISPSVFKEINIDIFNKMKHCSPDQGMALYNIAIHDAAYGKPYSWSAHEVQQLGYLFTYVPDREISSLHLKSMTGITKQVMMDMQQSKLASFGKQQILRMTPPTRRIYIIRTQLQASLDMDEISHSQSSRTNSNNYLILKFSIFYVLLFNIKTYLNIFNTNATV